MRNAKAIGIGIHASFALALAVCAACGGAGGGAPPAQVPPSPSASASSGEAPAASVPSPGTMPSAVPSTAESASAPSGAAPGAVEMKSLIPTAMADDLHALGLDAKSLPPIEKLEPRALRGVMKLMAKSLGFKCADCHQEGDFAAPTRRKKIAAHMWDEFAAKMSLGDAPLFCDSCHQGRVQLLDRRDKKLLSKWMDDEFASKLSRHDGQHQGLPVECETCHVDMDMRFLAKWGR